MINPKDSAKLMYIKLKAEIVKHLSGSSVYSTQVKLVYKQFSEPPMLDNFEKHITFYHSQNANLIAVSASLCNSFLAFLLLHSFHASEDSVWSIASTNIIMSDMPINQWCFQPYLWKTSRGTVQQHKNPWDCQPLASTRQL